MAVALHPDFGIVLDVPEAAPNDVMIAVSQNQKEYNREDPQLYPVRERRASLDTVYYLALLPPLKTWWQGQHLN